MQDGSESSMFPAYLPFELIYNEDLNLITQRFNPHVHEWITKAYATGSSLSTPLGKGSFSLVIADDVIDHIKKSLFPRKISECSFLEIGCGEGYLLSMLKDMGAKSCLGIEPDPRSKVGSDKYHVNIIHDFFNPDLIREKFDVIFSYGVLEHIPDPLDFLQSLQKCLKKQGIFFSAVPGCEKGLNLGDFSLLVHEHYNYFTAQSLHTIYRKAGLTNVSHSNATCDWALLYMWGQNASRSNTVTEFNHHNTSSKEKKLFEHYIKLYKNNFSYIQNLIASFEKESKTIGIYGAYPHYMAFKWQALPRIFDGDEEKHGKYLPGNTKPVESPLALVDHPVDVLLIAPVNHDAAIQKYIREKLSLKGITIVSVKEILDKNIDSSTLDN